MPDLTISTWQPWRYTPAASRRTAAESATLVKGAQGRLCIKGTDGTGLYGPETWARFRLPTYAGKSNDDLEREAKRQQIKVDLWVFPYLRDPAGEAAAIHNAIARWNPERVYIDSEFKDYAYNVGPFLRSLGRVEPSTWLQSFRFPDYHQELDWRKWLSYTAGGRYIIDGLSPQFYYEGSQLPAGQVARCIEQWDRWTRAAGRDPLPWLPTLPTYTERGWTPTARSLELAVNGFIDTLAERVVGFNFWRQGFLFAEAFSQHLTYINELGAEFAAGDPDPPPPAPRTLAEVDSDLTDVETAARARGWEV